MNWMNEKASFRKAAEIEIVWLKKKACNCLQAFFKLAPQDRFELPT